MKGCFCLVGSGVFVLLQMFTLITYAQKGKLDSEVVFTIERTGCFGDCPIYSAEIRLDGTVVYHGERFVKTEGHRTHKISPEAVQKLVKLFQKKDFLSMKDRYETNEFGMSLTDLPTTITSFSLDGETKTVVNYFGAPRQLESLEDAIDRIGGLLEYIGPV